MKYCIIVILLSCLVASANAECKAVEQFTKQGEQVILWNDRVAPEKPSVLVGRESVLMEVSRAFYESTKPADTPASAEPTATAPTAPDDPYRIGFWAILILFLLTVILVLITAFINVARQKAQGWQGPGFFKTFLTIFPWWLVKYISPPSRETTPETPENTAPPESSTPTSL